MAVSQTLEFLARITPNPEPPITNPVVRLTPVKLTVTGENGVEFIYDITGDPDALSNEEFQQALVDMQVIALDISGFPPPAVHGIAHDEHLKPDGDRPAHEKPARARQKKASK